MLPFKIEENMSVTFFLTNHNQEVKVLSKEFNPSEPEDPIYNPRYELESIYPKLNLSNSNACHFLIKFNLMTKEDLDNPNYDLCGTIPNNKLDEFCYKIDELRRSVKAVGHAMSPKEEQYFLGRLEMFDKIARYAIGLNDSITWA